MIAVTEEAKELVRSVELPEGTVFRLDPVTDPTTGATQVGMAPGEPKVDDQVIEHEGEDVLCIAGPLSEALDGSTIRRMDTPDGPGIGIAGPEEASPSPNGTPPGGAS